MSLSSRAIALFRALLAAGLRIASASMTACVRASAMGVRAPALRVSPQAIVEPLDLGIGRVEQGRVSLSTSAWAAASSRRDPCQTSALAASSRGVSLSTSSLGRCKQGRDPVELRHWPRASRACVILSDFWHWPSPVRSSLLVHQPSSGWPSSRSLKIGIGRGELFRRCRTVLAMSVKLSLLVHQRSLVGKDKHWPELSSVCWP